MNHCFHQMLHQIIPNTFHFQIESMHLSTIHNGMVYQEEIHLEQGMIFHTNTSDQAITCGLNYTIGRNCNTFHFQIECFY